MAELGYQGRRPSLYDLTEEMERIDVPTLILAGDEEEPCLEACLLMKRCIPTAGLAVLSKSGHAINLEEPALFNQPLEDFLDQVEAGRWARAIRVLRRHRSGDRPVSPDYFAGLERRSLVPSGSK
jgi:hypothetical protein